MSKAPEEYSPLSAEWAFVVHFRLNTEIAQGHMAGRVEHVVSGQSSQFSSLDELLAFISQTLTRSKGAKPRTD